MNWRHRFRMWTVMFDADLDSDLWPARQLQAEDIPHLVLIPPDTGLDPWEAPKPPKPLSAEEADRLLTEDIERYGTTA